LSTGREDYFGLFHDIADEAAFAGAVLVCAANNVPAPTYPAQFSSVISVAAHDEQDPFGIDANPAPPVDFGAPGIDVQVAWLSGSTVISTGNSFAAPHVTGLVARLLSKHPHLTRTKSRPCCGLWPATPSLRESGMTIDLRSALRGTDLLSSVPAEDLEAVIAAARLRIFRRGQVVFTRGLAGHSGPGIGRDDAS
jgi:subtilisin family serine protease